MRAPDFWAEGRGGLIAAALAPAAAAVAVAGRLRRARTTPTRVAVPVVCVGNLTAGGAGKTPLVMAVCARLAAAGARPHVISRGYRGSLSATGPHRVDPTRHSAAEVGDEPLLMAARRPVWIGRDRLASARAAAAAGADVLVMDDGHQNPSLAKDRSLLAIDAGFGHGNGRVLPAGPLREPLSEGFARADAAVVIGARDRSTADRLTPAGFPTLTATVAPTDEAPDLRNAPVFAFAGIGRPQKFFDTLDQMGARVVGRRAFPDHHAFDDAALRALANAADDAAGQLATTEKDAMRLPAWIRARVAVIPVALRFDPPDAIDAVLAPLIAAPADQSST